MSSWTDTCCYTEGVECDKAHTDHCDKCGFKPFVQKQRVAKIKAQLTHVIVTKKKPRGSFVYYAPQYGKEAGDGQD